MLERKRSKQVVTEPKNNAEQVVESSSDKIIVTHDVGSSGMEISPAPKRPIMLMTLAGKSLCRLRPCQLGGEIYPGYS